MNRRNLFTSVAFAALILGVAMPLPSMAESYQDQVVRQLTEQGYGRVEVSRSLLGRLQITARKGGRTREIVLNPRNGEVLRDLSSDGRVELEDDDDKGGKGKDGSNSGRGSSDENGDDDSSGKGGGSDDGGSDGGGGDDGGSDDNGGRDSSDGGEGSGEGGGDDGGDD